jgi:hypothetical protein
MIDHICKPMPSTGSHLPNYAARCKMGERHRLPPGRAKAGNLIIGAEPTEISVATDQASKVVASDLCATLALRNL